MDLIKQPDQTLEDYVDQVITNNQTIFNNVIKPVIDQTQTLVVIEDTIKSAKKQHSDVNKAIKEISGQRKQAKKDWLGKYQNYESTVMSWEKQLKAVNAGLQEQIDYFAEQELEKRRKMVQDLINVLASERDEPQEVLDRFVIDEKRYITKKQSKLELERKIVEDFELIEQQLRNDELAYRLINQEAESLGLDSKPYIDAYDDLLVKDVNSPINTMHNDIRRIEDEKKKHQEALARFKAVSDKKAIDSETGETKDLLTTTLELTGTLDQLKELRKFIDNAGITYKELK
ncbi:DUF1351 domain-containing protein [Limosilactobacillus gastricus]|uniref:DUF1351 domain-containing protein n=1 Tax=Limosilactobacillus gastricus TaxID=227942 RepID=UPI0002D68EFC|nr:DUF1351 domain-containing protein [Limosilactobacillus gastricus]